MKVIKAKINSSSIYTIFDINTLVIGEIVTFDIYIQRDDKFVIIIEAGTKISETLLLKLSKNKYLYISNTDSDKQKLNYKSLKNYIKYNKDDLEKVTNFIYEVNQEMFGDFFTNKSNDINLDAMNEIIVSLINLIKSNKNSIRDMMPFLHSDYKIPNHSLHVAIYSLKLGHMLHFSTKELLQVGTAALLHDVGYKKVDKTILHKDNELTVDELHSIQQHVNYSIEIIKHNKIFDPYIINAISQHHERYDGSGYPNKITEKDINIFASIISICDVFDALTNHRPHRKGFSSFDALKMMMKDTSMINQFNQRYLKLGLIALLSK